MPKKTEAVPAEAPDYLAMQWTAVVDEEPTVDDEGEEVQGVVLLYAVDDEGGRSGEPIGRYPNLREAREAIKVQEKRLAESE